MLSNDQTKGVDMENVEIDSRGNRIGLLLDEKIYPREVSLAAAYRFIDRCYVRLERTGRGQLLIWLKGKRKLSAKALEALAGDYDNELLQQLMRQQVAARTTGIREAIVGRALMSAEPWTEETEPDKTNEIEELDYTEDPLGIAVPWEEKYGGQEED